MTEQQEPFPNTMDLPNEVVYTYGEPVGDVLDVTFTFEGQTQSRNVNVVLSENEYDINATELRVNSIASGIKNKIAAGVIIDIIDDNTP
jgi:hypothetical protein